MAESDGFLIPGEVAMGNCYKVFFCNRQIGIFGSDGEARNYIRMQLARHLPRITEADFKIQLAFIEGIGF